VSGRLGMGQHRAFVRERNGGTVLGELDLISGDWQRVLDAVSTASVAANVSGSAGRACCRIVSQIQATRHELVIYRNNLEAWVGVLSQPSDGYDAVTLSASDLTWWYGHRVIHSDHTFTATDAADVFVAYSDDALSPDPVGLTVVPTSTGVVGDWSVLASDYRYASDVIGELLRTAVDLTVVGRRVYVGGTEVPADPIVRLNDGHFKSFPTVDELGDSAANVVYVRCANGIVGTYGAADATYGLLEKIFDEQTITDQTVADAAAKTRWDLLHAPPLVLSGSAVLNASAPVTLDELVPGARVRLELSGLCRPVVEDQRLSSVQVSFTPEGEDVAIELQPIGSIE
jgi:hypothetical protein